MNAAGRKQIFFDARALDSFDQYLQDVERYPLIVDPLEETGNRAPGACR